MWWRRLWRWSGTCACGKGRGEVVAAVCAEYTLKWFLPLFHAARRRHSAERTSAAAPSAGGVAPELRGEGEGGGGGGGGDEGGERDGEGTEGGGGAGVTLATGGGGGGAGGAHFTCQLATAGQGF